jgi:hypothetical protein
MSAETKALKITYIKPNNCYAIFKKAYKNSGTRTSWPNLKVNKIKKNTWSSRGNNSVVRWFY